MRWIVLFLPFTLFAQVTPNPPTAPTAVTLPITATVSTPNGATAYTVNSSTTSGATVITVCPSSCSFTLSQLQNAINAASCTSGNAVIKIQNTASISGAFTLPAKSCGAGNYITITTDTPGAGPAPGTRIGPSNSGTVPKIIANTQNVPAFAVSDGPNQGHWILSDLEVDLCSTCSLSDYSASLVAFGNVDFTAANQFPANMIVDRMLIRGVSTQQSRRAIDADGTNVAVINSYMDEFHELGQDTQAVFLYCAPGPYLIDNNYMEAAGENFISGGADCGVTNDQPADITFTHNYLFKPQSWRVYTDGGSQWTTTSVTASGGTVAVVYTDLSAPRPGDQAIFANCTPSSFNGTYTIIASPAPTSTSFSVTNGGASGTATGCTFFMRDPSSTLTPTTEWSIKNLFELKAAQRVKVVGNVLTGIWAAAQNGRAIAINSANQDGAQTWANTGNLEVGWNIGTLAYGGWIELACFTGVSATAGNVGPNHVHDNLVYQMGNDSGFFNSAFAVDTPASCLLPDQWFNHNTFVTNGVTVESSSTLSINGQNATGTQYVRFAFNDNIEGNDSIFGFHQNCVVNSVNVNCYTAANFFNDMVYDTPSGGLGCDSSSFGPHAVGTCPIASISGIGFTNVSANNYSLTGSSPGHNAATDGLDVGVSVYPNLLSETAGSISGSWSAAPPPAPTGMSLSGGVSFSGGTKIQ